MIKRFFVRHSCQEGAVVEVTLLRGVLLWPVEDYFFENL
jgi:hypothetical protein